MSDEPFFLPDLADGEDKNSPFKNRIRKNYRHIRKFAKRTKTNCFRIYDRDIKEFPFSIDFYAGRFCVYYYATRGEEEREERFVEVEKILSSLFGVGGEDIVWKNRVRRGELEQYERVGEKDERFVVFEYGVKFWVNLTDRLDTGLFLDHRETRRFIAREACGKHLLNLFAYTCSFSVHAALQGALSTTSVDLSNTYTAWGRDNFLLNGVALDNHAILREDCLRFLEERGEREGDKRYDIIVIDPPTLSRSKKMKEMFDVQRDYAGLIKRALLLLKPGGMILFSTNFRKFVFDESLFSECGCEIREISERTIPLDFHNKKIHRCWVVKGIN